MKNKFCNDERCLFFNDGKAKQGHFNVVTEDVREGKGLWERCLHCALVINRNGVTPQEVESFYNKTYVQNNSYSQGELLSAREHFDVRLESVKVISDFIKPHLDKDMRVFELGAATGELLYLIKNDVKYCFANEINHLYTAFIKHELNIEASSDDYLSLEFRNKFDFVISINTIDHIYNPLKILERIYTNLNSGGYFYIEVPNDEQALKSYLLKPQRSRFKNFMYQKAHYYSFTFKTLSKLLKQKGFEVIQETSRHDYSLMNYLNWYFLGSPQKELNTAMGSSDIHLGSSNFEKGINNLFSEFDKKFRDLMSKNKVGESLCILARKS